MNTDILKATLPCRIYSTEKPGAPIAIAGGTLTLTWDALEPYRVNVDVDGETWSVGRNQFRVAALDWYRGQWTGQGDFRIKYTETFAWMLFFPGSAPGKASVIAHATPIQHFIRQTEDIIPGGEQEHALLTANIEAAIAEILK